jgi:K+-sensing histidine kinase KdpD
VNTIIHALQYIDEKETITIEIHRKEKKAQLECSYAGHQYPDDLREKLIRHFSGSDVTMDLNFGIELALAQLIMEAHRGAIEFASGENHQVIIRLHFILDGSEH